MSRYKNIITWLLLLPCWINMPFVHAQSYDEAYAFKPLYTGFSFSQSKFVLRQGTLLPDGSSLQDRTDFGYKLFAGLNLSPTLSIEGNYTDFGEASWVNGGVAQAISVKSFGISGIYNIPIDPAYSLQPYFALGLHTYTFNEANNLGDYFDLLVDAEDVDKFFGLGFNYLTNHPATLRFAIEISDLMSDDEVRNLSVGMRYEF